MKKEYTKPQLVKHGKLEEQTQAGALGSPDGVGAFTGNALGDS